MFPFSMLGLPRGCLGRESSAKRCTVGLYLKLQPKPIPMKKNLPNESPTHAPSTSAGFFVFATQHILWAPVAILHFFCPLNSLMWSGRNWSWLALGLFPRSGFGVYARCEAPKFSLPWLHSPEPCPEGRTPLDNPKWNGDSPPPL